MNFFELLDKGVKVEIRKLHENVYTFKFTKDDRHYGRAFTKDNIDDISETFKNVDYIWEVLNSRPTEDSLDAWLHGIKRIEEINID